MGRAYTCCSTRKLRPEEMSLEKDTANKTTDKLCETIGETILTHGGMWLQG